jgi:hypothetical protein
MIPGHCIADVNRKHYAPRMDDDEDGDPNRVGIEPDDDEEWEEQDYNWRSAYVDDGADRKARLDERTGMGTWQESLNLKMEGQELNDAQVERLLSVARVLGPLKATYVEKLGEVYQKMGETLGEERLLRVYDALRATKQGVIGSRNAVFRQLNKKVGRGTTVANVDAQFNDMDEEDREGVDAWLMRVYRMTLDLDHLEDMFMLLQNVLVNDGKLTDAWRSVAKRSCAKTSRSTTQWEEIAKARFARARFGAGDISAAQEVAANDESIGRARQLLERDGAPMPSVQRGRRTGVPRSQLGGQSLQRGGQYEAPQASRVFMPFIVAALNAAGVPYPPALAIDNDTIEGFRAQNPREWDRLVQVYQMDFGFRSTVDELPSLEPDSARHLPGRVQENLLYRPSPGRNGGAGVSIADENAMLALLGRRMILQQEGEMSDTDGNEESEEASVSSPSSSFGDIDEEDLALIMGDQQ